MSLLRLAVLVVGEAGIGKTRLASEFVAWAQVQGALVLSGQAFEMGGRLPYQPLVEALRTRLEAENAPEDLLDDVWLAELSRLQPELRVRYPDLPAPTKDELTAKLRLFEAVARLLDALARPAPLVLLLEDLHWLDGATLDLLRFLGHSWSRHGSRILLLGTLRREGLEPRSKLSAQLADLGHDLPIRQVALQTLSLARTLPPTLNFQRLLPALGSAYHAVQQWEEAQGALAEADAMAETLNLGPLRAPALSRLCMHYAEAGEWEQASRYALEAIAARRSSDVALIPQDFSFHYETEALLRGGDERQARAEVQRLGERVGANRRYRLPYLRSEALLSAWDGHSEQAIGHLREAAGLAADLGLPGERWQIQAALGRVYEAGGEPVQARTAFEEAATIIGELAEGITDETRRARFLAGPQIQPVLRMCQ